MASPMPVAPMGNWGGNGQARPPPPPTQEAEEMGVQIKTMGRKDFLSWCFGSVTDAIP